MLKNKKYNLYAIAVVFVLVGVAYILEKFWTLPAPNYNYPYGVEDPEYVYSILFGLIASLFILLLFNKKIFITWLKYIGSWSFILLWWLTPGFAGGLFFDVISIANLFAGALFVITLIYALIMSYILKNEHVKR